MHILGTRNEQIPNFDLRKSMNKVNKKSFYRVVS